MIDVKYKEEFGYLVRDMEIHLQVLVAASHQLSNLKANHVASTPGTSGTTLMETTTPNPLAINDNDDEEVEETKAIENRKPSVEGSAKETFLGKNEEIVSRTKLLSEDETTPPIDPLTSDR